jgi:hypothetical protein
LPHAFPETADLTSTAILFSDDTGLCAAWASTLMPHGWCTIATTDPDEALAAFTPELALVLLDSGTSGAADFLARLRGAPQPAGGVPVLQHGDTRWAGTSALVPAGGVDTLIATIEAFTGGLSDHGLREPPFSPFYRLVRLLGARDAAAMIARFADTLCSAVADAAISADEAHRLAGVAGAIGYTDLSLAWRAAEQDHAASDAAITAACIVLDQIEHLDLDRYRTSYLPGSSSVPS